MSTFIPAIPLLTADESTTKLAKTVVETSPGVFALNTINSGGSEIPIIKFDTINRVPLSMFRRSYMYYNYPNDDDPMISIQFPKKELNIIIIYCRNGFRFEFKYNNEIVYTRSYQAAYFAVMTLPVYYQPVGLPE